MHLRPAYHHSITGDAEITVEQEEDGPGVTMTLEPEPSETFDDAPISRTLTSSEARELAAMLWHHADEADRRLGLR